MNLEMMHPRDLITLIMKRLYGYGMTTTSGGNLSILDNEGNMWISPGSVDKGTLRPEDIVCVKADGTIVGIHKPSSEFPFHRHIYKLRPDIKAVLHAHPAALVAFSITGRKPNTSLLTKASEICGEIGFAGYEIPGSEALGNLVSADRLVAVVGPDSAPIKRMIQESRERGMLIDATYGRKTASIFIMDSDHVILSALPPERFGQRLAQAPAAEEGD